ncbi:hypothetical protein PVAG01_09333 [Phlyctema vagabunda]|uniref:Fibroin-3 related protein n=1 Tax=Phlyctema vagabunda TaxID=108571 RepID=A0ABR4P717_9HELO
MPHISEAMQRSVQGGVLDRVGNIVVRSLLGQRAVTDEITNMADSLKSWDNCMAYKYCKWPAIAIIIVVALMVLSIVSCIIRCACCGMSCCCTCFSFLKCCDCCGGSCEGKKNKPHKHLDDSPFYNPAQGYQAPAPMMGGGLGTKEPPQYASFEVGKNGLAVEPPKSTLSEDALPPMPSWDTASKKRVLTDEKDGMELGELDPSTGQKVPLMAGSVSPGAMTPGTATPMSVGGGATPYGAQPGQQMGGNGYMGANGVSPVDAYGQTQPGYSQNPRGYGGPQDGQNRFASPAPQDMGRGYGSPAPQGSNRGFNGSPAPDAYNDNGYQASGGYSGNQYSNEPNHGYPQAPQRQYSGSSRGYQGDQYNNPMPPQNRGPSRGPGGSGRIASPPLNNNSGFDFGGGQQQYNNGGQQQYNARQPQQMPYGRSTPRMEQQQTGGAEGYFDGVATAPPSYASRSPAPQEQPSYPGYKSYQPQSNSRSQQPITPGGTGRQPDQWDPVNY